MTTIRRSYPEPIQPTEQLGAITWHVHVDDYGLYSFEKWWLSKHGVAISPVCPSETPIADVEWYCNGEQIGRVVRTETKHGGDYALIGRGFDGRAGRVIAIECFCESHKQQMA
jgi:hypothetical protein